MQLSGYNIGTFTLPFVQAFFPASSLLSVIVFDAGNAIMVLGGNYSIATGIDVEKRRDVCYIIFKKHFALNSANGILSQSFTS